jgi:hypothetical protein
MTIREAIRKISSQDVFESVLGTVTEIDQDNKTCTVKPVDDLPDLLEVRLSAVVSPESGIVAVPSIGSFVIVGQTAREQPHILMMSEIDSYQLIANDTIQFNDGENGGLVKVSDLVSKLNAIEDKVNELITNYKAHNHVHPNGPTTAFVVPYTGNNLTNTQVSDLENENVKH